MSEAKESFRVEKWGKKVLITDVMLINDDIGAIQQMIQTAAGIAADKESDLVYGILNDNPKMADGKALFHTDHKNIAAAGVDVAGLSALRALALGQKSPLDKRALNILLKTIIVPVSKLTDAEKLIGSIAPTVAGDFNPFAGRFGIVADGRLAETHWFAAADPNRIDTIELAYLEGMRGLQTETVDDMDTDGVAVKAKLWVAAKALDHVGLVRGTI